MAFDYNSDDSQKSQGFLKALKREFTINDILEKYGQGGYGHSETHRWDRDSQIQKTIGDMPHQQPYIGDMPYQQNPSIIPGRIPPYEHNPHITPHTQPYVFPKDWNDELEEALKRYEREQREETLRRQDAERYALDQISRHFKNDRNKNASEKKQSFKAAFIQMISDKINFDESGNLLDEDGKIIKSIGAFVFSLFD